MTVGPPVTVLELAGAVPLQWFLVTPGGNGLRADLVGKVILQHGIVPCKTCRSFSVWASGGSRRPFERPLVPKSKPASKHGPHLLAT